MPAEKPISLAQHVIHVERNDASRATLANKLKKESLSFSEASREERSEDRDSLLLLKLQPLWRYGDSEAQQQRYHRGSEAESHLLFLLT